MTAEERTIVKTAPAGGFLKMFFIILVLGVLLLFAVVCGSAALVASSGGRSGGTYEEVVDSGTDLAKVLVVEVSGPIGMSSVLDMPGTDSIEQRITEAVEAASRGEVAGILLDIDSPGGAVATCDRAYHQLRQAAETKGVKIYAHFRGLAASGGYYIACAADRIYCEPTCITGSIGVIMESYNVQGLLQWLGVSVNVYKSGEKKDMLSPFRPASPAETEQLQSIIDEEYGRFVSIVEKARKLSHEKVLALADGGIYSSMQALNLGLVDQIAYKDEVYSSIRKELNRNVSFVTRKRRHGILDLLGASAQPPLEQRVEALMKMEGTPVLLYMWKR